MQALQPEQQQEYALAASYEQMSRSAAWQDVLSTLESAAAKYEATCTGIPPEERAAFDLHFAKWQERKGILLDIHERVNEMARRMQLLKEEMNGDPSDSTDHVYTPGSDTRTPGY